MTATQCHVGLGPISLLIAVLLNGCAGVTFVRNAEPSVERSAYQTLEAMVRAYEMRDARAVMDHVSEDFAGDESVLDSAIRRDFSRLARIDIDISPAGAAVSMDGNRVQLIVQFTRQLTPVSTGVPVNDRGLAQLVFERQDGVWKLVSMRHPSLFGMSGRVASGRTRFRGNTDTLKMTPDGDLTR